MLGNRITAITTMRVGLFFADKFLNQASQAGTFRAASNMRKQGVPLSLAVAVLAPGRRAPCRDANMAP